MDTPRGQSHLHQPSAGVRPQRVRTVFVLSSAPAILMAVAVAGLAVDGYYPDMSRAAQALGGGDLVALVLAAPLLAAAPGVSLRRPHAPTSSGPERRATPPKTTPT
jgi:hypothetical protein